MPPLAQGQVRLRVERFALTANTVTYATTGDTLGYWDFFPTGEPCEAIVDGELRQVPALEEREEFSLDGVLYEAFNTSGGLGTLCETLAGKVRTKWWN